MAQARKQYDAIIVGAGPVGLLLGSLLRRAGLDVVIIEKRQTRSTQSKASTINAYSLAILRSIGIVDECIAKGLQVHNLVLFWQHQRLMRVNYRRLPSRYDFILCLSQPEAEFILEQRYLELGGELRRSTEVANLVDEGRQVTVTLSDGAILSCTYLVGCDGARSTVRRLSGIAYEGEDLGVDLIMCDCRIDAPDIVDADDVYYHVDEENFSVIIPLENGKHRIYVKRRQQDAITPFPETKEYFQSLLNKYGAGKINLLEIFWTSKVAFYYRLASKFQSGRVYLCGDAAHVFPPLGGMGMNTGFQDAVGLAWRIVAKIRGTASEEILSTYTNERRGIAKVLIERSVDSARLISRIDTDVDGALQAWLPRMNNRKNIANTFPINYSGLAQTYTSYADSEPWSGKLIPYFEVAGDEKQTVSYDYIDPSNFVLFAEPCAVQCALGIAKKSQGVRVVELSSDRLSGPKGATFTFEGAALMRPDGVVCAQTTAADLIAVERALAAFGIGLH